MWSSIGHLAWRNRGKLTAALVISLGVAMYMYLENGQYETRQKENVKPNDASKDDTTNPQSSVLISSCNNSRSILYRVRKQYDTVIVQFLCTLRGKIIDLIDISAAIRHIKELRSISNTNSNQSIQSLDESALWEEIKIKSFDIDRQRERKTFHRRDGYMNLPSNESNFYPFSDYQLQ
jgi:PDZ domain-containing secreted protein